MFLSKKYDRCRVLYSSLQTMLMISLLWLVIVTSGWSQQHSVRFFGNGVNAPDQDRIKIRIDDPANSLPGPPSDLGSTDFTIEFWIKGNQSDNTAPAITCGSNINWIYGNIIIDRDRYNQDKKYGISLADGYPVFGISGDGTGDQTICAMTRVLDGDWHHLAFQRRISDGWMSIYIDGSLETEADGPDGDISYPDNGTPMNFCGPDGTEPCLNSDPFIVLGAEKHDAGAAFPSFNGFMEELRLSNQLRYTSNFLPALVPFNTDEATVGLYHFDEGIGAVLTDVSGAAGGPSNGEIRYGGNPMGPEWSNESPFLLFLSVEMSAFTADLIGRTVALNWSTQSENGSSHFEIERSEDAESWTAVGQIDAAGESTDAQFYSWVDNQPFLGISYYRIKMVDLTTNFSYSGVAAIDIAGPEAGVLVFPNPTSTFLHVLIAESVDPSRVKLYNSLGREVTPEIAVTGPYYSMNTSALYTGIHWLVIERDNYQEVVLVSVMR